MIELGYGEKYIGEVVEIKVDNANGKHSAVFKMITV